jgi:phosphoribosylformylglycinamidine cyclo-ligase
MSVTYRDAGVDLEAGADIAGLFGNRSAGGLFAGILPVPNLKGFESPVLVTSMDGIGTKTLLASRLDRIEGLGEDIVHHCVNDIAVHGAEPLLFMDYLAFHRIDRDLAGRLIDSISAACERLGVVLTGGETAEMPLIYPAARFDVVGAIVGVVEASAIVDGRTVQAGDVLLGLKSSGLHTNGFSLIQRLFDEADYRQNEHDLGSSLGEALLTPHRCYLDEIRGMVATGTVHGLAHITGGGIKGNLDRIIPAGLQAVIDMPAYTPLFELVAARGVEKAEMRRVFNCGVGLVAVCDAAVSEHAEATRAAIIGEIVVDGSERRVRFRDDD